jgi:molybdate transport system substrate-binding protein
MLGVLQRLGIADDMRAKTVTFRQRPERFAAVARGDVEIGFNQVSEILAAAGVELLGPLPAPIQNYTLFAGAVARASREPQAAQALLRFLSSPAAQATWKAKGFEAP